MKTLFISLMAMLSSVAFGQLNEDFSSSNFSKWKGDTNEFMININQQLQSNASGAGTSWMASAYHLQNDYSFQLWLNIAF